MKNKTIMKILMVVLVLVISISLILVLYPRFNNTTIENYTSDGAESFTFNDLQEWIVEGDKVYTNDSKVYISAYPHTLSDSGWVYFNITSKVYTGNVDVVWGFNTTELRPRRAQLFKPHNITKSYTCLTDYFNYTQSPKHFWCYNNITTYTDESNITMDGSYLELIYERDFEWGDIPSQTAYWNITENYKDISGNFESIDYNHGGMSKWWYKKNFPIVQDQEYQVRILIKIPREKGFSPKKLTEKYWFAIKPSDETISEAISSNHFYALDPWVNSSGDDQSLANLDVGLESYWNLSGENDTFGFANFTTIDNVVFDTGLIENGAVFDRSGSTHLSDGDKYDMTGVQNFTVNFWANRTGADEGYMIGKVDHTGGGWGVNNAGGGQANACVFQQDGVNAINCGFVVPQNVWYMFTLRRNDTGHSLWVNGSLVGVSADDDPTNLSNQLTLGAQDQINANYYEGIIDELSIHYRALSDTEIMQLYNDGLGLTYNEAGAADIINPNVTITIPLNQTYNINSFDFNVTALDETGMDSCLYSLDSGVNNITMTNSGNEWNGTNTSMLEGSHTISYYCNDTSDNLNNTESVTFFIDTINPNVTINIPLNKTYTISSFNFNVTALDETAMGTCLYSLDSGVNNLTMTNLGNDWNATNDSMTEGSHTINYYCNDSLNNLNGTESVTFSIDLPGTPTVACDELVTTFAQYTVLIGLVGSVFFIGLVILVLTGFATKNEPLKRAVVFTGILTIILIAVLVIIAIVMFQSICTLF
ncbi:MAG: LamG domain-containing protein [Candidatus Heimdallarchaeaceae archaeon]